ncbi:Thiopurine S-methyltransferase [Armadillidium vulgare]|nr:Thiopurine S-methyltransferase [Armadillidium vulgare]
MSAEVYSVLDKSKDSYSLWETLWSKNTAPWHQKEVCPFLLKNSSNLELRLSKEGLHSFLWKSIGIKMSLDQRIKIYVADIFSVEPEEVGKFDVIWARGDYTTVKIAEREKYSKLMKQLCKEKFLYFLCTLQFEVPVGRHDTPPRPISHEETRKLYSDWCKVDLIEEEDGLKFYPASKSTGTDPVYESYFILTPK